MLTYPGMASFFFKEANLFSLQLRKPTLPQKSGTLKVSYKLVSNSYDNTPHEYSCSLIDRP